MTAILAMFVWSCLVVDAAPNLARTLFTRHLTDKPLIDFLTDHIYGTRCSIQSIHACLASSLFCHPSPFLGSRILWHYRYLMITVIAAPNRQFLWQRRTRSSSFGYLIAPITPTMPGLSEADGTILVGLKLDG